MHKKCTKYIEKEGPTYSTPWSSWEFLHAYKYELSIVCISVSFSFMGSGVVDVKCMIFRYFDFYKLQLVVTHPVDIIFQKRALVDKSICFLTNHSKPISFDNAQEGMKLPSFPRCKDR